MKLRRTFPALTGTVLTGAMVDKRLRQLDQDVEIDYWRIGLLVPAQQETRAREPTLKTTASGSLVKSVSSADILSTAAKSPPSGRDAGKENVMGAHKVKNQYRPRPVAS